MYQYQQIYPYDSAFVFVWFARTVEWLLGLTKQWCVEEEKGQNALI